MTFLDVIDLHKSFGGVKALNNLNFSIQQGKITAIIGPNGSGKTTAFNVISRLFKEDSGRLFFNQHDITNKKDYQVAQMGVSRTFQQVRLFRNLTLKDHLEIALDGHKRKMQEIVNLVGLEKGPKTLATDLSYGQRKLMDLAMAIAKPHTLLMLDEPVAGVNPKLRAQIKHALRELNAQGETILIIEHDMNFVMDLADHIIVMDQGTKIFEGTPKQVQNNPKVLEAYLGK